MKIKQSEIAEEKIGEELKGISSTTGVHAELWKSQIVMMTWLPKNTKVQQDNFQ